MADDYTPTTEPAESILRLPINLDAVRLWLAAHDREVAAKAWDEGFEAAMRWIDFYPQPDPPANPHREGR